MQFQKQIRTRNILVVGDVMLDQYYQGKVGRISPEAPVPVFLKQKTSFRLGGAANVAMNLAVNNQNVKLLSIIGHDQNGRNFEKLCNDVNINTEFLVKTERPTCTKTRLLAGNNQQVIRIDEEIAEDVSKDIETKLEKQLLRCLDGTDLVIISDYLKGVLTDSFTQTVICGSNSRGIKVLVDVKDPNAKKYKGAYVIKPNTKELHSLTGLSTDGLDDVKVASNDLLQKCDSDYVLTTCGSKGMVLVGKDNTYRELSTTAQEVFDVTGAGDTVIAYLGMCLANGFSIEDSMDISNFAAGIQVSKVGTSPVFLSEVEHVLKEKNEVRANAYKIVDFNDLKEIRKINKDKKLVFTNGCFDILHAGHVRYLKEAADLGDLLVLGLNSDDSVKRLKGESRPINNQEDRAEVLASLQCVDYVVIFEEDTPYNVIKECQPDILAKGGDYKPDEVVGKDIVEARGGKVVLLPFVKGRSTTSVISKIKSQEN